MKNKFVTKYTLITLLLIAQDLYSQDSFILNYEDVDIRKVTQDIAQFSKKTIILDPRVKGKITIYSNANLNRKQVWDVYLRTIQVNGFSAVSEDGFLRRRHRPEIYRSNIVGRFPPINSKSNIISNLKE